MRPRLLDLFCGAGGAGVGYHRAGFDVVGVDLHPQPNYPFEFHQADALTFPLEGVDAIHASPPCQHWTAYKRRPGHVGATEQLVNDVRSRLLDEALMTPYVIENVAGAPLLEPLMLCGSMFDPPLDVQRHRFFELGIPHRAHLPLRVTPQWPCRHKIWAPRFPSATNRTNLRNTVEVGVWRIPLDVQQRAMDIDWMTREELSQAIPPAYTEWIGRQLLSAVEAAA